MGTGLTSQKMIREHGSIDAALLSCQREGIGTAEIAKRFGSTPSNISNMAKRRGITLKSMDRHEVLKIARAAKGCNTAVTAAMHRTEEEARAILAAQVTIITRGDPQFDAVAADIMRQRETCNRGGDKLPNAPNAGKKHDAGKIPAHSPLAYFPRALEGVAEVCAHGEKLHGYDTWSTIDNAVRRYQDADTRHELALCKGETHDIGPQGSGLHHLKHRAWNALALLELEMRKETP